jgi:hypothetical protein
MVWLWIGTSGGLLWTRQWTWWFCKRRETSWQAEQLLAPQEGLTCMGFLCYLGDAPLLWAAKRRWMLRQGRPWNGTVSSSKCVGSSGRFVSEYWIEESLEGSGCGFSSHTSAFARRVWGKATKTYDINTVSVALHFNPVPHDYEAGAPLLGVHCYTFKPQEANWIQQKSTAERRNVWTASCRSNGNISQFPLIPWGTLCNHDFTECVRCELRKFWKRGSVEQPGMPDRPNFFAIVESATPTESWEPLTAVCCCCVLPSLQLAATLPAE